MKKKYLVTYTHCVDQTITLESDIDVNTQKCDVDTLNTWFENENFDIIEFRKLRNLHEEFNECLEQKYGTCESVLSFEKVGD